jgi:hypothetical protein
MWYMRAMFFAKVSCEKRVDDVLKGLVYHKENRVLLVFVIHCLQMELKYIF